MVFCLFILKLERRKYQTQTVSTFGLLVGYLWYGGCRKLGPHGLPAAAARPGGRTLRTETKFRVIRFLDFLLLSW